MEDHQRPLGNETAILNSKDPSMKRYVSAFLFLSLIGMLPAQAQHPLTVMSYNIRLDLASDSLNAWPHRKEKFASMIRFYSPDIVGLQEAQRHQIAYLEKALPEYGWFGIGRDDGKEAGEFMAVFYRKDRLDTVKTSTFWCSPTPDRPGLGWDAMCNRVVTWGKFKDKRSKRVFYHFNTHLDHMGVTARKESARLISASVDAMTKDEPVIITGDFNSRPAEEPYQTIISGAARRKFVDSKTISTVPHHGPNGTFTGFNISSYDDEPIDYIFVSKGTTVMKHATLSDSFNGRFPSDHFAVIAEILFPLTR